MGVDILMGANAGVKTCGVTWGNGTIEELKEAEANYIIDKMEDLLGIISHVCKRT
jgi:phosphoglycolate phosphatase